ncbi:hypothetical protein ACFE04_021313 [Oxalis oulophora]
MARDKIKYGYIQRASCRRACFKSRRKALTTKVYELTKLCSSSAFIILFNHEDPHQMYVWPHDDDHAYSARHMIQHYRDMPPDNRDKNTHTIQSFLRMMLNKLEAMHCKIHRENRMNAMRELKYEVDNGFKELHHLSMYDKDCLLWYHRQIIEETNKRIVYHNRLNRLPDPPLPLPLAAHVHVHVHDNDSCLTNICISVNDHSTDLWENELVRDLLSDDSPSDHVTFKARDDEIHKFLLSDITPDDVATASNSSGSEPMEMHKTNYENLVKHEETDSNEILSMEEWLMSDDQWVQDNTNSAPLGDNNNNNTEALKINGVSSSLGQGLNDGEAYHSLLHLSDSD